jgi:hypothetical protein
MMPGTSRRRARTWIFGATGIASLATVAFSAFPAAASPRVSGGAILGVGAHQDEALQPAEVSAYGYERTAPGLSISGQALVSAEHQAALLPVAGGSWTELTNQSDNLQPAGYNDPVWSNVGAGFRNTSGRVTTLAFASGGVLYMGSADGGVWKSTDSAHNSWAPVGADLPSQSVGAIAVNPADNSLWVGLGEANTNADSYAGQGVFRSADGGATFSQVGGTELSGATMYKVYFDGTGVAYAATNHGLWRRSLTDSQATAWSQVFQPDPQASTSPYHTTFVTDVITQPGSDQNTVLLADGWRGAGAAGDTTFNGFYVSTDHGLTFSKITPTGAINAADIGRTTFAYSADGTTLYAVVESPSMLATGKSTVLQGVFKSTSGPGGPWTSIANSSKLCSSGSACSTFGNPGVQAWYNEAIAVDPADPNHVILGLEEDYQSFDGGTTWTTINPYWNYSFACDSTNPPTCPPVTHPDQHAVAIDAGTGTLFIGNDGGVYSRPLEDTAPRGDWTDLNDTLHTLQYYDAEAGAQRNAPGMAEWGGLQDNGTTVLFSGAAQNITPAGGDGGGVIVNPRNAQDAVGEYVDLNTYLTTDGGQTFRTISPSCFQALGQPIAGCDPSPRFISPLATDVNDPNHWVIGGRFVWNDTAAWSTVCQAATPSPHHTPQDCDFKNVHDSGAGHSITAIAVNGNTIYAAWCGGGCNPGGATPFSSGIDTNFGGKWHTITASNLPNRFIQGLTVDKANPGHVFAIYNGYSRRWINGAGVGHVFESANGGATFTDISGNLPDIPGDALVYAGGKLALATDIGTFIANAGGGTGTSWSVLGTNMPNVSVNNLRLDPDGSTLLAATHGRGLWSMTLP